MQFFTKPTLVVLVSMLSLQTDAVAQEDDIAISADTFRVTIVEAMLKDQDGVSEMNDQNLWSVLRDPEKVDWKETVQCTVLDKNESNLMFGRNVSVLTGITESSHGETRTFKNLDLGTGIQIAIESRDERVAVELEYQATRLSGDNDGELPPPTVETNEYVASLQLVLGKPKLLVATPNSMLMINVEREADTAQANKKE